MHWRLAIALYVRKYRVNARATPHHNDEFLKVHVDTLLVKIADPNYEYVHDAFTIRDMRTKKSIVALTIFGPSDVDLFN